jgi:hypothetical protein
MANDSGQGAATASRCAWCSTELPAAGSANCPTCGATLVEPVSSASGVNAPDAETISRAARTATPIRRSRLVSWITGEYDDDETPAPPGSLAPPPPDVRREMARLAFQAEYASLQAEVGSIESEAKAEARAEATEGAAVVAAPSDEAVPPAAVTGAGSQPD